jgi:surfeit locus 1 family protein
LTVSRFQRREVIAVAGAVVIAAGCIRLGVWQLARLGERRERNRQTEAMMRGDPVPLRTTQPAPARLTRVVISGRPDYRYEIALTGRSRNGSPGVDIVTPMRLPGTDTAVLVNRGWVYSPDASQVSFKQWREADSLSFSGYVDTLARGKAGSSAGLTMRILDHRRISAELPYPIAPFFVVALPESETPSQTTPVRLPLPALDEGPHKSYAIQWFSFATIAIVGTLAYLVNSRRPRADGY